MTFEVSPSRPQSWPDAEALRIPRLGACRFPSPVPNRGAFVDDTDGVVLCTEWSDLQPFLQSGTEPPRFELAGPRHELFFDPQALACGIVTCGGLCPGLNNVVRAVVLQLHYAYGVRRVFGFRYGYAGLAGAHEPVPLTAASVEPLHKRGGTELGSSRGPQDLGTMIDTMERLGIGILFVIGGDGGLRGASALCEAIERRNASIAVIGVPKTIDNDLLWTARSFGFDTAVEEASETINAAHVEACGAWNGVGLVKLMGRHSGFIAAHATLATSDVNFCLVPEVSFALDGPGGFLTALERRLREKHHAVVVVAEGAGQEHFEGGASLDRDASGNVRLRDIGTLLRDRIRKHFAGTDLDVPVRYIDPSYTIRSQPANSFDAQFCLILGQHAVHAGMAGRTNMVVGLWNQRFVNVPIPLAIAEQRQIDPQGELWQRVLEASGQPAHMGPTQRAYST